MTLSTFRSLAIATALIGTSSAIGDAAAAAAPEQAKGLAEEQRDVDGLLEKADTVELRKLSPRVLGLADRLLREKGDAAARSYFEKGLQANSWALEEQLTLGEILARGGQPEALREKAEMVLRVGEEDGVLKRASRLIDRPLPELPAAISKVEDAKDVLILARIGETSLFTLNDLRDALAKRLGIRVVVASLEMEIPKADRTAKTQWVVRMRERVLSAVKEQPSVVTAQLSRLGFTVEQITTDNDAVVALFRKTAEVEQGQEGARALDAALTQYESVKQWDVAKLLPPIQVAVGDRVGPKRLVLGVTTCDLFGGSSNYLFGTGLTGKFLGVVSLNRFRAAFNDEPPKRERLTERLLKQSLSTIGFMLGVPRCTTPECARAFPESLAEHDRKPLTLCPACRAGFETLLGVKLPPD